MFKSFLDRGAGARRTLKLREEGRARPMTRKVPELAMKELRCKRRTTVQSGDLVRVWRLDRKRVIRRPSSEYEHQHGVKRSPSRLATARSHIGQIPVIPEHSTCRGCFW